MPATILAVDTATDVCSVALAVDDRIDEFAEPVGQKHSERVLPMVQALLHKHRLQLAQCDAIAFGAGPGAFTGLRIACGIAQGLAFGVGKPVLPVGNLRALALVASGLAPQSRRIVTAIDARMQEIYWAVYAIEAGLPIEIAAPALAAAAELPALCRQHGSDLAAGNALSAFADIAAAVPGATAPAACASAAAIVRLARVDLAAGRALPPELAAPVYVRDRVALTIEQRRAAAAVGEGQR